MTDPLFQTDDFFDPDDVLQVKYEMLRRVRVDKQPVSGSASAFGFSRPTYYQAEEDFQRDGLYGLLPEKRGPRQGHKLTPDILKFALQLRASDPSLRAVDLATAIQQRFATAIHARSIERALGRQEKTSLNPSRGDCNAAEPQTLISAYEDLRQQAVACSSSGGLGMALFLDPGIVAWMQACSWAASANPHNSRQRRPAAAPLPDDVRGEIVLVMAAMASRQAPEAHL